MTTGTNTSDVASGSSALPPPRPGDAGTPPGSATRWVAPRPPVLGSTPGRRPSMDRMFRPVPVYVVPTRRRMRVPIGRILVLVALIVGVVRGVLWLTDPREAEQRIEDRRAFVELCASMGDERSACECMFDRLTGDDRIYDMTGLLERMGQDDAATLEYQQSLASARSVCSIG